jgi:hypothetical protein
LVDVETDCRESAGFVRGWVVNGNWTGEFREDRVTVRETGKTYPGSVVWRGDKLPFGWDYNQTLNGILLLADTQAVERAAEGPSGLLTH